MEPTSVYLNPGDANYAAEVRQARWLAGSYAEGRIMLRYDR